MNGVWIRERGPVDCVQPNLIPVNPSETAAQDRLEILRKYPVTDGAMAESLAEACRLATLLCHRPMAAVEWVQDDEVLIAAAAGLPLRRLRLDHALSPALLAPGGAVVVADTLEDPRFAELEPVRKKPFLRFYAGVPLVAPEGVPLGMLSVADGEPGTLTPEQEESLKSLGRMVMAQLNLARRQRQLEELEAQHARVEVTLRETEANFRGIFENTVVGIYQTTPDGRYLSANPMLAHIYGYSSAAELIRAVGDIEAQIYVDPQARDRFVAALQAQDTITNFEAQIRRKDGAIIWIAENARVVRSAAGQAMFYEGTVQDITARKAAEDQLRHSEMLYHSLVEELPQNVFRKDRTERFIFANSRFCETVARPLHEILGRTDFDLYSAELATQYQADDQRVMNEGRTLRKTERNVGHDGAVHWVEVVKSPLRDVSGAVVGIQGIFWDVTETKRLQDALAYERDLLQALLDHSPDSIYFKDTESRFVKVGRALARRFNVADPEQLVGMTAFSLLAPDLAQVVYEEEQRLFRTGEPIINAVEELIDYAGLRTWASITKVPIYNRSGEILGMVCVARDITKLIQTEQALREAEEKYRTIFENSVEGIYQTLPEGRFMRVNPAFARIYGYNSPEEVLASRTDVRTQVYVNPERRAEFVRQLMEKESLMGFESEIYRRDGSRIWISESARLVRDRKGEVAYFEGSIEDITARKQVETEREKAQQAALESARLKAEFVATVSHEIRTPLNAIAPNTELLLETKLDKQQRYLVESVDHGAHMLLQIVNDVLDVSRIEAGAVALEEIEFPVHETIERTITFFAGSAHEKHLEIVGSIRPDVPRRLRGDPARLMQVLNNLLANAIKFTAAGEVVVEVELGAADAEFVELHFRVRDTGIGIPDAARGRVFQAFAQADGSMSRRYGGTGLGLAITRGYVALMHGEIDFDSQVGEGTTFRFHIRLRRPAQPVPEPAPGTSLTGLRALVIEDNASQRRVMVETFQRLGARAVVPAENLSQALEMLRAAAVAKEPFDLIFFDSELPGSDGLHAVRRLRSGAVGAARLIALNPPGTVADARGLEAVGVFGSIGKPLRQSRIDAELRSLLTGEPEVLPEAKTEEEEDLRLLEGLAVLIVEDNSLNQRVAKQLIQRLGARVDAVSSGPEAISAFRRHTYDLILMDCQMPDMDGYETTRRIRDLERQLVAPERGIGRRIFIVALSANALSGDRDKGMEAGMDDYLTKPLRQPELLRVLKQAARLSQGQTPGATGAPAGVPGPEPATGGAPPGRPAASTAETEVPVLDRAPLLALLSPDEPGVLGEFVGEFLREAPRRIELLRELGAKRDPSGCRSTAHSLKGNASYMGARRLVTACARLEQAAESGDWLAVEAGLNQLGQELEAARRALEAFVQETAASATPASEA